MKNSLILCALLTLGPVCYAQQSNITDYTELTDTKPHDSEAVWNKITTPTQLRLGEHGRSLSETQYPNRYKNFPLADESLERRTRKRPGRTVDNQRPIGRNHYRQRIEKRFIRYPGFQRHHQFRALRNDRRIEQRTYRRLRCT